MKNTESANIVFSGFLWRLLERVGAQGVTFVVSMVLARILEPSVFGTVALITAITNILSTFIDSGMGSALIQKKDADDLDFSTLFYFNFIVCILLYVLMFLLAPYISAFYNNSQLTKMTRVVSLTLIISGVKNIQNAYVSKHMLFKRFFFATLSGTIGAAFIGIYLALKGYGAWALIIQSLFNNMVDTIILWITVKWRPKKAFSIRRLKLLFNFGWKMLASKLIDKGYTELRTLIIGKKFSPGDLAFYNRGSHFPSVAIDNINSSIDSVLFPTMSSSQEDLGQVRLMARRAIKTSTFIIMPMMAGLAACATPLVRLLLTEKWLPCVLYMRIFCITYAFYPIHTANLNAIKALGRSDLFLILEIIKKIVGIIAIIITMNISVAAMAYSLIVTDTICQIVNSWPNRKLLNYRYYEQVVDMLPQLCLSCLMGGLVYSISLLKLNDWLIILIQVPVGVMIYFLGAKILHIDSLEYIQKVLNGFRRKKREI